MLRNIVCAQNIRRRSKPLQEFQFTASGGVCHLQLQMAEFGRLETRSAYRIHAGVGAMQAWQACMHGVTH